MIASKNAKSDMNTLIVSRKEIEKWLVPPFQRRGHPVTATAPRGSSGGPRS